MGDPIEKMLKLMRILIFWKDNNISIIRHSQYIVCTITYSEIARVIFI